MEPATEITQMSDVLLMGAPTGSAAASLPAVSLSNLTMDFDAANCSQSLPARTGVAAQSRARFLDLYELTKPRMNFLVVATTLVGYFMATPAGADRWHWTLLLHTLFGTALTAAAASVLNQYAERDYDRLMPRTRNRPLPAGRIAPTEALFFGVGLGVCGMIDLALFVNSLTAILGAFTLACYVWLYTPLKRHTTLCTVVGAIPGALPPVMGVTAALGAVTPTALVLFIILFMWQMPHFLAIAILYRDDYARGGFKMLPVVDRNLASTGLQIVLWSLALVPVTLTPVLFGVAGATYFVAAFLMSLAFLGFAVLCALRKTRSDARHLFLASIVYLPCLLAAMMIDKV
jgi:protoheme IX farnesyltransferase